MVGSFRGRRYRRVKSAEVTAFTNHFARLLAAKVRVGEALEIIAGSPGGAASNHMARCLLDQLHQGLALSDAVACYPKWFPPVYQQLVQTGELSGQLARVMHHLGEYRNASHATATRLKRASVYPLVIVLFAVTVLMGLLVVVIPRFRDLFADSGTSLPLLTQTILAISNSFIHYWWLLGVGLSVVGVSLWLGLLFASVRRWVWRLLYASPFVGEVLIMRKRELFLRSLALMLAAHLPLLQCITLLTTAADALWQPALQRMEEALRQGHSLDAAMRTSALFAESDLFAARIGQHGAKVDALFILQADQYAQYIESRLQRLAMLLEPGLMLVVGLVIAMVVAAVYMPLFSLGHAL